jgi:hypothetical protein
MIAWAASRVGSTLMTPDTSGLIKPFTAQVGSNGIALVNITQSLHGLAWVVYQIGFALNIQALAAQVAAHVNGTPLASTVGMQISAFASLQQNAPYAMESFMVGPPYVTLEAGDAIVCAVTGAVAGDTFTAAAYVNEIPSPALMRARNARA